jgi:hypothetical protein
MDVKANLTKAITDTFFDMAFLDVVESEHPETPVAFSQIMSIQYLKPVTGYINLFLPIECKKAIVENIHTKEWSKLSPLEIDDCLLEILNVLAGNYLINEYGCDRKYVLSFPQVLFDKTELESDGEKIICNYDAEGILFSASISEPKNL